MEFESPKNISFPLEYDSEECYTYTSRQKPTIEISERVSSYNGGGPLTISELYFGLLGFMLLLYFGMFILSFFQ